MTPGRRSAARTVAIALRAASALAGSSPTCALDAASAVRPHPHKTNGGEDALFCGDSVYGVFDGVGGWASKGIDAGDFSRRLATATHNHLTSQPHLTMTAALKAGLGEVKVLGSCTACMVRIRRSESVMQALNLGDSGWRCYRPDERKLRLVAASKSQQHYFNVRANPREHLRGSTCARAPARECAHLRASAPTCAR